MIRKVTFAALFLGVFLPPARANDDVTKIVLIGHDRDHPFGSHMYLHECRLLAKCLEQTPRVETVISNLWPREAHVLEGVDALVFYSSPAGDLLLKGPHRAEAERLLAEGVGYAAIHWATGARGEELGERYLRVLGGWFDTSFGGLDVSRTRLLQIAPEHPVCRGWDEYEIRDEFYLNTRFMPQTKPILKVQAAGREQVVAWSYVRPDSDGGRSFGTTLGHFHDNFELEAFRRALVNGILWTARRDVPQDGAPVKLTEQETALPPRSAEEE